MLFINEYYFPLNKNIYIASDHAGYDMKAKIINFLLKRHLKVTDLGTNDTQSVDLS